MSVSPFRERITTEQELRDLMGFPGEPVVKKVIDHLDPHCREFIGRSPFLLLATADNTGACDVSPRGDDPGFVHIVDDHHLVVPDRPGNRRLDSLRNILSNPRAGLIFLIPGMEETLRINGRACIFQDSELLYEMEVKGKIPKVGIGMEVEECYIHCPKAFKRSHLWQPDTWPNPADLPSPVQMAVDHMKLPLVSQEKVEER
ncbi:pyridoxamine 5'-phosphate oxidase family protein [Kroppenstedtia sanguinis]|uniref:Pyridoxamine 5'-phosphate oxidase family protein n=1 Tax=Kroppenstedtia sanguinis TaxID=1380684 RepID=A0ABW4CCU5_9BACL